MPFRGPATAWNSEMLSQLSVPTQRAAPLESEHSDVAFLVSPLLPLVVCCIPLKTFDGGVVPGCQLVSPNRMGPLG